MWQLSHIKIVNFNWWSSYHFISFTQCVSNLDFLGSKYSYSVIFYVNSFPRRLEGNFVGTSSQRWEIRKAKTKRVINSFWVKKSCSFVNFHISRCLCWFAVNWIHSCSIKISSDICFLCNSSSKGECLKGPIIIKNLIEWAIPVVMSISKSEIVKGIHEVLLFNEETTIICIVNKWYLTFESSCPSCISITPWTSKFINIPWVSHMVKSCKYLTSWVFQWILS